MTNESDTLSREDFRHFFPLEVRWGDADALGHINNVQFFRYLESARVAYCAEVMDLEFKPGGDAAWILAEIRCRYLRQVHYPGTLEIGTATTRLGERSATLDAIVYPAGETSPVATSRAVVVWFDYRRQRTAPIPRGIRDRITAYERIPVRAAPSRHRQ